MNKLPEDQIVVLPQGKDWELISKNTHKMQVVYLLFAEGFPPYLGFFHEQGWLGVVLVAEGKKYIPIDNPVPLPKYYKNLDVPYKNMTEVDGTYELEAPQNYS
jgi:hypothetical protein